jgi:hypothetical protein
MKRIQINVDLRRITMLHFHDDCFDTQRIQRKPGCAFHGKEAGMSEERAAYHIQADRPPLAGALESVFQSVVATPTGEAWRCSSIA